MPELENMFNDGFKPAVTKEVMQRIDPNRKVEPPEADLDLDL